LHRFRRRADSMLDALCFSWGAIATVPALAVDPVEARFWRIRGLAANRKPATMLTPPQLLVTINLYWVKKSWLLRFASPQEPSRFLDLRTTFMLGEGTQRIWMASLWLSASCQWSCWPYSQPRTGVVNRCPGIVSDRTPLARMIFAIPSSCRINVQLSNLSVASTATE